MNNIAIKAEKIGKLYRVGQFVGYKTLREGIANAFSAPFRRLRRMGDGRQEKDFQSCRPLSPVSSHDNFIWALKDISFEVEHGEVVGIIGRNGAGKTTLLKILSRIAEPTEGYAEIHGRIGSLLEVGTGFHPELTGRENIYLNGAVLGMKKTEIERKFDEIVAFAQVDKFIDTPLKRFSSGMQVRLAFSVAAHLEPEILLVDEVLAVGDAAFQKKCMGKMGDVARGGRTVLLVSHNMAAIINLCKEAILLESGIAIRKGPVGEVVQEYLSAFGENSTISLENRLDRKGDGKLRFNKIIFADGEGNEVDCLQSGSDSKIILEYTSISSLRAKDVLVTIAIDSPFSGRLCVLQNDYAGNEFSEISTKGSFLCNIPKLPLTAGIYPFTIAVTINGVYADWIIEAGKIRVEAGDYYGTGKYPDVQDGRILMQHEWTHKRL